MPSSLLIECRNTVRSLSPFTMNNAHRPFLGKAFALSFGLHAAALAVGMLVLSPNLPQAPASKPAKAELTVSLREPLVVPPAPPRLLAPPELQPNPSATAGVSATRPRVAVARQLQGEMAVKATEQVARELYYPPEAIERGLQGDVLVMLFLDGSGKVIAARLETSSGHALLDDAALRAARSLSSLPGAPREALLPVRFRLR